MSAVLVGETTEEIIVAFRGTEPFDTLDYRRMVMDWLTDLDAPLVAAPNVPGSVHQGFSHDCNQLWSWVLAQVQALPTGKPLYVTGHSKGGALANIAAVKFVAAGLTPFVCTFEGVRAGDQAFADGYAKLVVHSTRYEYQDDIVPHLPPDLGFQVALRNVPALSSILSTFISTYIPVGDLRFIDWQGDVVGDSPDLEGRRLARLSQLMLSGRWGWIIQDHSISPGSGAAAAICGPVWPAAIVSAETKRRSEHVERDSDMSARFRASALDEALSTQANDFDERLSEEAASAFADFDERALSVLDAQLGANAQLKVRLEIAAQENSKGAVVAAGTFVLFAAAPAIIWLYLVPFLGFVAPAVRGVLLAVSAAAGLASIYSALVGLKLFTDARSLAVVAEANQSAISRANQAFDLRVREESWAQRDG